MFTIYLTIDLLTNCRWNGLLLPHFIHICGRFQWSGPTSRSAASALAHWLSALPHIPLISPPSFRSIPQVARLADPRPLKSLVYGSRFQTGWGLAHVNVLIENFWKGSEGIKIYGTLLLSAFVRRKYVIAFGGRRCDVSFWLHAFSFPSWTFSQLCT